MGLSFDFWQGTNSSLFFKVPWSTLCLKKLHTQRYLVLVLLGVKWIWHEADHSPPSGAKVKKVCSKYRHYPTCLNGMHRDDSVVTLQFGKMGTILTACDWSASTPISIFHSKTICSFIMCTQWEERLLVYFRVKTINMNVDQSTFLTLHFCSHFISFIFFKVYCIEIVKFTQPSIAWWPV
jgi:hypothetical protein